MTNKEYGIIMGYFDGKKMGRKELESVLDFENLTMEQTTKHDITKLFRDNGYSKNETQGVIRRFVYYVKDRSGSGEITWDEFIKRLDRLCLEDSEFGIRVQRFGKESYWEVFFNHFDITEFEDGKARLTLDHDYYWETENEKAWESLDKYGIDGEMNMSEILSWTANKWSELSKDEQEEVMSAIAMPVTAHYVDKSNLSISNEDIKSITMTNADLVPQMGLRDYTIAFTNGEMVHLRF